jgi:dethiobiotin synthetase
MGERFMNALIKNPLPTGERTLKGIFITGTDTGVGKTYVASGIAAELSRRGVNVGVMKPAETGCSKREGKLVPRDALRLMRSGQVRDPLSLVNPYRFQKPLAPLVAAGLVGKSIEPEKILVAFRTLSRRRRFMIVEGAGGILVPLRKDYSYLDLARALGLPVLIVARPGLGTINHTLLTIAALKAGGVPVAGIVMNSARKQGTGMAEATNPRVIEKISGIRIWGAVAFKQRDFHELMECMKFPLRDSGSELSASSIDKARAG